MSTVGLRKVGNYEEALARATKDEQHVEGTINPYLANAATRIINNPEFQRVKDRMMDDLEQQQRAHLDQRNFETHVHGLATEARINRSDLQYLIENLQQPPPAPVPAPPQTDAAADRERLLAELDGLAQEREARARQEMTAQQNARDLAASRVETPAQQIVREYHQTPIYIPTPHTPPQQPIHIVTPQQDWSGMMTHSLGSRCGSCSSDINKLPPFTSTSDTRRARFPSNTPPPHRLPRRRGPGPSSGHMGQLSCPNLATNLFKMHIPHLLLGA